MVVISARRDAPRVDARAGKSSKSGDSIDVVARTYHTENGVAHVEGDAYAVTDRRLAETLYGIGFVSIEGWSEAGVPPATATGATAGSPGTWTPAGSTAPLDLAACAPVVADPVTAWTAGQHMILGDASLCHWSGAAWVTGSAAAARAGR